MTDLRNEMDYPTFLKWGFTSLLVLMVGFSVFAFVGNLLGFMKVEVNDHGTGAVVFALVSVGLFLITIAWIGLTVMYWAMKHFK